MKQGQKFDVRYLARGGLLIAVAVVLSWVERLIPLQAILPVPGVKLGLANLVTVFVLCTLDLRSALLIVVARVVLVSLLFGSASSFAFSLVGGVLAALVMWLLLRAPQGWFSLIGVSVAGAAAHHIGQMCAAVWVMGTIDVLGYLPWLLAIAVPMGFATGVVCTAVLPYLGRIKG